MRYLLATLLLFCLAATSAMAQKNPIKATTGGYLINIDGITWDKAGVEGTAVDVVVSIQPDYSKAKTAEDSTKAMEVLYKNPKNYSVATGSLHYVSENVVRLETKAKLSIPVNQALRITILDNDGKDNSGTNRPPLQAMRIGAGSAGTSSCAYNTYCACRCFRAGQDMHCVTCLGRMVKF